MPLDIESQHIKNTQRALEKIAEHWYPGLIGDIVLSVTDAGHGELVLVSVPDDDDFWFDLFTPQVGWRLDETISDVFRARFAAGSEMLCTIINVTDVMIEKVRERMANEAGN